MISQSHRIKGGTTVKAFQELCLLWERGASVDANVGLFFNFQDLLHAKELIRTKNRKSINGLLQRLRFTVMYRDAFEPYQQRGQRWRAWRHTGSVPSH